MKSLSTITVILGALCAAACSSPSAKPKETPVLAKAPAAKTISLAESGGAGRLQIMGMALRSTRYLAELGEGAPFTILAVRDQDVGQLPLGMIEGLGAPQLDALVGFHVLPGRLTAEQLAQFTRLETLGGQRLHLTNWNGELEISGSNNELLGLPPAHIVERNIVVGNGIIHLLDGLAAPATQDLLETLQDSPILSQLVAAAGLAGVSEILSGEGPLTIFAPTDEAFAALDPKAVAALLQPEHRDELLRVLRHHIVPGRLYEDRFHTGQLEGFGGDQLLFTWRGGDFFVDGAQILHADVEATNGVIHLIDRVLVD